MAQPQRPVVSRSSMALHHMCQGTEVAPLPHGLSHLRDCLLHEAMKTDLLQELRGPRRGMGEGSRRGGPTEWEGRFVA